MAKFISVLCACLWLTACAVEEEVENKGNTAEENIENNRAAEDNEDNNSPADEDNEDDNSPAEECQPEDCGPEIAVDCAPGLQLSYEPICELAEGGGCAWNIGECVEVE